MFVGLKMLISKFYKLPLTVALMFIVLVMVGSIIASIFCSPTSSSAGHTGNGNGAKREKTKVDEINVVVVNT